MGRIRITRVDRQGMHLKWPPLQGRRGEASIHHEHSQGLPTPVFLPVGDTGLQSDCAARAEDLTVVR
jgi:hypothetical protein